MKRKLLIAIPFLVIIAIIVVIGTQGYFGWQQDEGFHLERKG